MCINEIATISSVVRDDGWKANAGLARQEHGQNGILNARMSIFCVLAPALQYP